MLPLNLGIRFVLELTGVTSLALWGYRTPSTSTARVALAVAAPLVLILVWSMIVAPKADNPLGQTTRMLIGSVLLIGSAVALAAAGWTVWGVVFAAVVVLNTVFLVALPRM